MARYESAEEEADASWGFTLRAIGVTLAAVALTLLPAIALAKGSGRAFWMILGIVAFVVARAKLLTMLWALFAFVRETHGPRKAVLAPGAPRLSLAAITVVFVAVAIPHC